MSIGLPCFSGIPPTEALRRCPLGSMRADGDVRASSATEIRRVTSLSLQQATECRNLEMASCQRTSHSMRRTCRQATCGAPVRASFSYLASSQVLPLISRQDHRRNVVLRELLQLGLRRRRRSRRGEQLWKNQDGSDLKRRHKGDEPSAFRVSYHRHAHIRWSY